MALLGLKEAPPLCLVSTGRKSPYHCKHDRSIEFILFQDDRNLFSSSNTNSRLRRIRALPPLIIRIISGQLKAADGARVVKLKPRHDAVGVVDVLAGHLLGHLPRREILLADGALSALRSCNHGVSHDNIGERGEGRLGSRRRAVAVGVVLGELLDELFEEDAEDGGDVVGLGRGGRGGGGRGREGRGPAGAGCCWGGGGGGGVAASGDRGGGGEGEREGERDEGGGRDGDLLDEVAVALGARELTGGGGGDRDEDGAVALVAEVLLARGGGVVGGGWSRHGGARRSRGGGWIGIFFFFPRSRSI
ncbi:hypothetical protein SORBI_3001G212701 [Sorghum bicolor]|uniref:Uncharacterized protein n=1 Tax=Sorghum bicolor TaxID=4558 RepID=A0A1Z5S720_SORBI|nr:hypothetical protein SORBI_3001G212701 [Sorghum bicolor]